MYKTKRDVDVTLRQCTSTLEDPALRAFVLTNLEQVPPARATMNEGGGHVDEDMSLQPTLRWKIHWNGIVNDLDKIAGNTQHCTLRHDVCVLLITFEYYSF